MLPWGVDLRGSGGVLLRGAATWGSDCLSSTGVVLLGLGGSLNGVCLWEVALCDGVLSTGGDLYGFIRALRRDMIDPRVLGLCGACVVVVPAESLVVVPVALAETT